MTDELTKTKKDDISKGLRISDSELNRMVRASDEGLSDSLMLQSFQDELGLVVDDAASLKVFEDYAMGRFETERKRLEKKFGKKAVDEAEANLKEQLGKMKEDAAIPLDFTAPRLQGPGALTATSTAQSEVFK